MTPKKLMLLVGVKVAVLAAITVTVVTMVGCNTVAGVGKDVSQGGQAIERAADKAK